ncbi:MAG: TolC family protein [Sphingomonadales bacterium]|nr:TolC family protein [Sphingomonadales bacterium]MDE2171952.1 TolC family protein [Sphingomonadales bacterium]
MRRHTAPLLMTLLAGCAHYTALPLPAHPSLAERVEQLPQAPTTATPLSLSQVVALALANNPDLKAARLSDAVAHGATRQAGLLPNPQLSGAFLPLLSGVGSVPAWNIGLSQNIRAILTYRPHLRAAKDTQQQIAADIVWQEWQVAGQARQLAADIILGEQARPAYAETVALMAQRNVRLEQAMAHGNATLAALAPDRAALQMARSALETLDQRQLALRQQLNALLGLHPDARLTLAPAPDLPPFDPAALRASLPSLPDRRPDLIALRFGYASADEGVREAIAAQFPDLVLGGSGSSDNSQVINAGPNAALGLPVFDRNQGQIAIARATRAQLRAIYDARLSAVVGEVEGLLAQQAQITAQLERVRAELPAAREAAGHAAAALSAGAMDERAYVDFVVNRFAKEQEFMTLQTAAIDRQIALQTLTGEGLPTVATESAR